MEGRPAYAVLRCLFMLRHGMQAGIRGLAMPTHQRLAILIALRLYRAGRIGLCELYHRIACSYCMDFDKRKV